MDDSVAIWREALKDAQHPRYQAAWLLFGESSAPKSSARLLENRKNEIIPWLLEILDTPVLYEEGSLGNGYAPANAVGVLGQWQVLEVVPRLLHLLETEDWEAYVHENVVTALEAMGSAVVEPLLDFAERCKNDDLRVTLAAMLSVVGKGNERAYQWVLGVFNRQKRDFAIEYMAENLLATDSERAIPYLEGWLQKRKSSQYTRDIVRRRIEEARRGEL